MMRDSTARPTVVFLRLLAGLAVMVAVFIPARAQDNEECLLCHAEESLTGTRDGGEISVYVSAARFGKSVHAGLECVMCHQDLSGAELPHGEDVEKVDCGLCHGEQAEQHARSLHGRAAGHGDELAPNCEYCHGTHEILPDTDDAAPTAVMNIPLLCGRCHHEGSPVSLTHDIPQDRILENYSLSMHGEGLFRKGLKVSAVCTSCHTSHNILPHTDPASSISPRNVAATCTQCHVQIEQVHRKVVEGRLWQDEPHKIPSCVDCHAPHKIRRVVYPAGMANKDCLTCHGQVDLTMQKDGQTVSAYVDAEAYESSDHANTACAQCHADVTVSRERPCVTATSNVDCSICHAAVVEEYRGSMHGTLWAKNDPDAPYCLDCHQKHATTDKRLPASPTYTRNVPVLCARCHRIGEKAAKRIEGPVPDVVQSYIESIHGKGLLDSGLVVTANCASCHTAHGELPASDPRSSVNPANISRTCGNCHHGIQERFETSIHFTGTPGPGRKLPTCESCHTSHTISRTDIPGFRTIMMEQCGHCHETESETFFETFHGKVSRLGAEAAAKCYDCHGTHDILPISDPGSHLSRDNVVETCGKCHAGSHRRFAGYLTHATHHDRAKYPWLFWSFWLMTALLVGTLSFALLHTFAWLVRLWLTRDEWRAHKTLARAEHERLYRRFDRYQRTMHLLMMISFFLLALTGMALKFSYMGWAQGVSWLFGGFETMGVLHRLGAVTLVAVFVTHLVSVWRRKERSGTSWKELLAGPDAILFTLRDMKEIFYSVRWFFGLGERPRYGRYTYWEKFDYFAVFWGVLVIGSTGLVLWFPELFTYVLPGWSVNVATIIHSDEALLAVGFIFTIHFFNTHFRPDKFPMDPVIFTGRVTMAELKYDKPREYEQRVSAGDLEQYTVEPFPRPVERGFKVFGFVALAVGLTLIALILYAMLFEYR